jgi:hypothetical protein
MSSAIGSPVASGSGWAGRRWWAGLYEHNEYFAIPAVTMQWKESESETGSRANLLGLLAERKIAAIVLDADARGTLRNLPEPLREQFDELLTNRVRHAGTVTVHPYGEIDVYLLDD